MEVRAPYPHSIEYCTNSLPCRTLHALHGSTEFRPHSGLCHSTTNMVGEFWLKARFFLSSTGQVRHFNPFLKNIGIALLLKKIENQRFDALPLF